MKKKGRKLSARKAREMIDNPPGGRPLSKKQNSFFHAVAEGRSKKGRKRKR